MRAMRKDLLPVQNAEIARLNPVLLSPGFLARSGSIVSQRPRRAGIQMEPESRFHADKTMTIRPRQRPANRAKIGINPWFFNMSRNPIQRSLPTKRGRLRLPGRALWILGLAAVFLVARAQGQDQEDPLNKV